MNYINIYNNLIARGCNRYRMGIQSSHGMHKHRITPGYMGGEYISENISILTRQEHRIVHKIRYRLWRNWRDNAAAAFLGGKLTDEQVLEIQHNASVAGGRRSGALNRELKRGICGMSPAERSAAGRKGALKLVAEGRGIHGQSKEQLRQNQMKAVAAKNERVLRDPMFKQMLTDNGKKQNKKLTTEARQRGGRTSGKKNAENGHTKKIARLGGLQHKGRKWIINSQGERRRPPIDIALEMIASGQWKFARRK